VPDHRDTVEMPPALQRRRETCTRSPHKFVSNPTADPNSYWLEVHHTHLDSVQIVKCGYNFHVEMEFHQTHLQWVPGGHPYPSL
jgi:hypothetical protein